MEKLDLAANLNQHILKLQWELRESNRALEQTRVDYMQLETESATTDMKHITLKGRLAETQGIVVAQEQELGEFRSTVRYLEGRVQALGLILDSFQEHSTTLDSSSDSSVDGDYEVVEYDIDLD